MATIKTESVKIKQGTHEQTHIDIDIRYNKGMYYIDVYPVKRQDNGLVSVYLFKFKTERQKLLKVNRASKKAEAEAIANAEIIKTALINNVCQANNFILEG